MTETSPSSPERLPATPAMYGLQGRMELVGSGQDVLNINNKKIEVSKELVGKHEGEFQKILSSASTNERRELWKQRGGSYEEQMTIWKQSLVSGVESHKGYFSNPEQADFFKNLGLESNGFDASQADTLYKKYFTAAKNRSQTDVFTQDVLKQLLKPDGTYDEEKLSTHSEGIRFMASIFGKDATEVIMQKLAAAVELKNNPDKFVEQTKEAVNTIPASSHEEHLVVYLSQAQQKYKEEEEDKTITPPVTPKDDTTPDTKPAPITPPPTIPPAPIVEEKTKKIDEPPKNTTVPTEDLEKKKQQKETLPDSEYDTHIKHAADYLKKLDDEAAKIQVDSKTGKINIPIPPASPPVNKNLEAYDTRFEELQHTFDEKNTACVGQLKKTSGVLDAQLFMGAVVVTYDSSKKTPADLPFVSFLNEKEKVRGNYSKSSEHNLGLILVDLNAKKRKIDKVNPTQTMVHEMQHHAVAMTDYLLATDSTLPLKSAYRQGRNKALFGDQHIARTDELYITDLPQYEKIMGRSLTPKDVTNIRLQQSYLDELHAFYLQKQPDWFSATGLVYGRNSADQKKHWELVGNNPADIEASKRLFNYVQGFNYMSRVKDKWESDKNIRPEQATFVAQFDELYKKTGSLIGAGRCIQQSERLIAEQWQSLKAQYPTILANPALTQVFKEGEKTGASLPEASKFLFG